MSGIPLKPDLVIRCGRHRYKVIERRYDATCSPPWVEVWLCTVCGETTTPNGVFRDCPAP